MWTARTKAEEEKMTDTAYWIDKIHMMYIPGKGPMPKRITVCSNCGGLTIGYTKYCPDCGKRMEGRRDIRPEEFKKGRRFV